MVFVKILKSLFLFIILVFFILTSILLHADITIRNTILSGNYFNKVYEKNNISDNIVNLIEHSLDNIDEFISLGENNTGEEEAEISPQIQEMIDNYKKTLKQRIDMEWIRNDIAGSLKGIYSYIAADNESLPQINIKPLKELYLNLFIEQILLHSDSNAAEQIGMMIDQIKNSAGDNSNTSYIDDDTIENILKQEQFKEIGLSKDLAKRIIINIMDNEDNQTPEEIFRFLVEEMVKEKLNYNEISDSLDLNLLINTAYGGSENPVSAIRDLVHTVNSNVFYIIITAAGLFFLILAITAFYPDSILKWLGFGMLVYPGQYYSFYQDFQCLQTFLSME